MKAINAILRFLAFVLLAVVVVALPISLLARDAGQLIYDADTIKSLVGENLLSPEFVGQLAQRAMLSVATGADDTKEPQQDTTEEGVLGLDMSLVSEGLSYLEEDDWGQIAELIAPPDVVAETVGDLVDAYVGWLDADAAFPQVNVDLSEWKQNTSAHAREVLEIMLAALPACTADQLMNQALEGLQEGEDLAGVVIPVCRPAEPAYSFLLSNADDMVSRFAQQMPDEIDSQLLQGESAPRELVQLKEMMLRARLILRWSWVAVLAAAALAVLMAARSWSGALTWAGWPLLLAGLLTLGLGFGVQLLASGLLVRLIEILFADAPVTLSAIGSSVAAGALPLVARPLLIQGAILAALGLISVIAGRALGNRAEAPLLNE